MGFVNLDAAFKLEKISIFIALGLIIISALMMRKNKDINILKSMGAVIGLACCAAPAAALAKGGWIADQKTGCQIKNPLPIPDESVSWYGECKDGKASGPGQLLWYAQGKLFLTLDGVMEAGQCRHNCTVSTKGGSKYVGDLLDNRPDGSGTMSYPDGTKHSGGWAGGKKHGKGVFTAKDGSSQEETWEHGKQIPDAPH